MGIKVTTVRLREELANDLAAVARADGVSTSEAVREAIEKHVDERRADPEFQHRVKREFERSQATLSRLLGD